jgi:alkylated DNA repair protein (DNA oxidative demethylase)
MGRMRGVVEEPAGLRYAAELLTDHQEQRLLTAAAAYDFRDVVLHGQAAKRTACHFGMGYEYDSGRVVPGLPMPPELIDLRAACAGWAGVDPERLVEALVTRYPSGAAIGWHRDAPVFGSPVVGVSLLSACTMRFQRRAGGQRRVFELALQPRSGYLLTGAARATWQHSIPPVPDLRYSITFRTVRHSQALVDRVDPGHAHPRAGAP